jgi:hypothetical protein
MTALKGGMRDIKRVPGTASYGVADSVPVREEGDLRVALVLARIRRQLGSLAVTAAPTDEPLL